MQMECFPEKYLKIKSFLEKSLKVKSVKQVGIAFLNFTILLFSVRSTINGD